MGKLAIVILTVLLALGLVVACNGESNQLLWDGGDKAISIDITEIQSTLNRCFIDEEGNEVTTINFNLSAYSTWSEALGVLKITIHDKNSSLSSHHEASVQRGVVAFNNAYYLAYNDKAVKPADRIVHDGMYELRAFD
ncbi:MAG: hypothetical protein IJ836_02955 [Spirochaetales bacterium]|nr:hypothetical protein [Spirochaetales bacterium]